MSASNYLIFRYEIFNSTLDSLRKNSEIYLARSVNKNQILNSFIYLFIATISDEIFGPKIKIVVKKATSLKNVVKFGTIDTYAEVTFEGLSTL